jgi:RNA polymerase sigma factor (sigma-70 family)
MTAPSQTVFVVDDNAAVRKSLERLFEAAGLTTESHATSKAFLAAWAPSRSGCLVLDLQLRGESGLDLLDELRARRAALPVIVLTGHGSVPASVRALKAGAVDFLEKPAPPAELVARVHEALALARRQNEEESERALVARRVDRLTARERQVARLLVEGRTSKQIAAALGVSVRTVEGHRSRLLERMQVASATELIATLLRTRVVPPA